MRSVHDFTLCQDDFYEGYFIPKGTLVIVNIWAMNRDPNIYPDYDEFSPERFLDETGTVDIVPADTRKQGHGFGEFALCDSDSASIFTMYCRISVGLHITNQALFIDIASLLWAASIEPAHDETGTEIIPSRTKCLDEGIVV
jgi:hypothetical protein